MHNRLGGAVLLTAGLTVGALGGCGRTADTAHIGAAPTSAVEVPPTLAAELAPPAPVEPAPPAGAELTDQVRWAVQKRTVEMAWLARPTPVACEQPDVLGAVAAGDTATLQCTARYDDRLAVPWQVTVYPPNAPGGQVQIGLTPDVGLLVADGVRAAFAEWVGPRVLARDIEDPWCDAPLPDDGQLVDLDGPMGGITRHFCGYRTGDTEVIVGVHVDVYGPRFTDPEYSS